MVDRAGALASGIETAHFDSSVRPQDDLFLHVNGGWITHTDIPADKASYGAFDQLVDVTQARLRSLLESIPPAAADPEARKLADFYRSFLDQAAVERAGIAPLSATWARIEALPNSAALASIFAELPRLGVPVPFVPLVHQDARDATRYVVDFRQYGLGLPDRDYYLRHEAHFDSIRQSYREHIGRVLELAGLDDGQRRAEAIVRLETQLAAAQWSRVDSRDAEKTYNPTPLSALPGLMGRYDWPRYLAEAGVRGVDYVVVGQPSYLQALGPILESTPLATWKSYLAWHLVCGYAPYLASPLADEHFSFYGRTLQGIPKQKPRWKRALAAIDMTVGFALGRLYAAEHFPASSKTRMQQLVANLRAAYDDAFTRCDWMDAATRQKALDKLSRFTPKIGYPDRWRDYSALDIRPGDLAGNVMRAAVFEYRRQIGKLGQPVDRTEWELTPQTINAYYNPEQNEIVFPAAILQPPFFDAQADDAVNYGGIGAVIGHEMSHGFDDQGAKYDGDGNLNNWWTPETLRQFQDKTRALVRQYGAYEPLPGHAVNGELTVGENLADNAGLAIAYLAYRHSLGGGPAPVIDGLTGDQRFFMGWAQVWRYQSREPETLRRLTIDPHSPPRFRVIGAARNLDAFYQTFDVNPVDGMYLAPEQRVRVY